MVKKFIKLVKKDRFYKKQLRLVLFNDYLVVVFNSITCPGILSNKSVLLFLGNYTADHPKIRYAYGSDHSDGLPIGSGTKYPEFPGKFRIYKSSGKSEFF